MCLVRSHNGWCKAASIVHSSVLLSERMLVAMLRREENVIARDLNNVCVGHGVNRQQLVTHPFCGTDAEMRREIALTAG